MASFFGRFKSGTGPASPSSTTSPTKRDPSAPQPTPLEKLLADAGPIRADGSDKFFGFENFGSTCYCNSIIQCLYYSVPFREQVINFPSRSPPEALAKVLTNLPRINTDTNGNGANSTMSPVKAKPGLAGPPTVAPPRKGGAVPGPPAPTGPKPEDNKDSPEYKKKLAMAAGPVIDMDFENSNSYGMPESLFTSLKDIFEAIIAHRSRIGVVSPNKFLEVLKKENEMFRTAMHQDAHEFLNLLLNQVVENVEQFSKALESGNGGNSADGDPGLATALSSAVSAAHLASISSNNTGWVHELFEGTLTSETRCLTCENTSQRDEAFLDLSVDLEQHSSVTSCLRKFSEEEMLCERNKFHCDNCSGLQEAEKRMKIKRLPRILALHLKRFKYTEDLQRLQKLFHRVVYPYHLRLFNTTDDAEDPDRLYELYAVVVHIGGGPYHGHYVSIIKTQDRGWLLFDDEMVEPVDKAYVRNFFGGENVLACAYVLFYQETTEEAMQKELEEEGLAAQADASVAEGAKEGIKANGIPLNGHAYTPITPQEEHEHYLNLDHAATAPPQTTPPYIHPPLEPTVTSPQILTGKKSDVQSKKERAREEKERKAAEKEAKRQQQKEAEQKRRELAAKRKEMEEKRRENYKRQEEEMKAAIAASQETAKKEERRWKTGGAGAADDLPVHMGHGSAPGKENGHPGGISGSLNRFRHTSMSLKHKPKLWPHKDKHQHEEKGAGDSQDPLVSVEGGSGSGTGNGSPLPELRHEKSKNRFSLGRKKSSILS